MVEPPERHDYGKDSPVTLANVLLTNKIYEDIVEELTERILAIRKLCSVSTKFLGKGNPATPIMISIMRILNEDLSTNLWNIGEDEDD
tara:strand:- start:228 stop:491 length:264 start_codon:yes stop_codon:yes gene_type:complete